jgi:hypothetical protein
MPLAGPKLRSAYPYRWPRSRGWNPLRSCVCSPANNFALWVDFWLGAPAGDVTVSPSGSTAVAGTTPSTVVLGSVSVTPTSRWSVTSSVIPTVVLGSLNIAGLVVSSPGRAIGPVAILGPIGVIPVASLSLAETMGPVVKITGPGGGGRPAFGDRTGGKY